MYQSRATDRENISGAAQLGFMAVVGGAQPGDLRWSDPDQDFEWIAADNSLVPMDAQTVVAFGKAAAERKQDLIFAGRQLKDMNPIPLILPTTSGGRDGAIPSSAPSRADEQIHMAPPGAIFVPDPEFD